MIGEPEISQQPAYSAAVIRLDIPREAIGTEMPAAIAELRAALHAQAIEMTGPLFCHHLRLSKDRFTFDAGFPVSRAPSAAGRVRAVDFPAQRIAHVIHTGPYDELFRAWTAFEIWLQAARLTLGPTILERYVKGPESGAPPAEWQTELIRPLAV